MGAAEESMDGVCIRLYPEKSFLERDHISIPEIKGANLAG
jgi:HrpA-like RNA helicase